MEIFHMAKIPAVAGKPAAPAAPSAKPGTPDTAGAKDKKKKKREAHPLLFVDSQNEETGKIEKKRVKLKAVPTDYDAKIHKPLSRKDFEDESLWYELKAQACEKQAAKFRQMATEEKVTGASGEKAKTKRLVAMMKKIEELKKTLIAAGLPVDDIIKAAMATAEKEAGTEATA
jgi:hypothetical protein